MANEKRLIDANALMNAFRNYMVERHDRVRCASEENCKVCERECLWRSVVSDAPTVDAVEVEKYIKLREQYDKIFLEYHELRDNFISYVCSGIPNPSPFCLNKRRGCCDSHGWCKNDDKCQGFNPAEVILDGAKMDGDENG